MEMTETRRELKWDLTLDQETQEIERLANIFKALSHPHRINIVKFLMEKGDMIISELQQRLEFKGYSFIMPHLLTLEKNEMISLTKKKINNRSVVMVRLKVTIKEVSFLESKN